MHNISYNDRFQSKMIKDVFAKYDQQNQDQWSCLTLYTYKYRINSIRDVLKKFVLKSRRPKLK